MLPANVRGCLLIWLVFLAYAAALPAGYVWDDVLWIWESPITTAPDGWQLAWTSVDRFDYYPITATVFWLLWQVFGKQLVFFHLTGIALHAVGVLLFWRILLRLDIKGAWLAAALFAVHPVTVASVAWIAEIKNTLSFVFYALTILAYLQFDKKQSIWAYVLTIIAYLTACLTKASVVVVPAVLVLLMIWIHRGLHWRRLLTIIPLFLITLLMSLVHIYFQHHHAISEGIDARPEGILSRITAAGWIVWFYLYKTILPVNLCMIYPRWNVQPGVWFHHLPNVGLILALAIAWYKRRHPAGRAILVTLLYALITLSPVLGLITMAYHRYSLVSDHLQHLTLPGTIALIAAAIHLGLSRASTLKPAWIAGIAVVIVLMTIVTSRLCLTFKDRETLWAHNVKVNPDAVTAQFNLANRLMERKAFAVALPHYQKAVHLAPDRPDIKINYAIAQVRSGRPEEAIAVLEAILKENPSNAVAMENLGSAYYIQGDLNAALRTYHAALDAGAVTGRSQKGIGLIHRQLGQLNEAATWFEKAVNVGPGSIEYRQRLVEVLLDQKKIGNAWPHIIRLTEVAINQSDIPVWLSSRLQQAGFSRQGVFILIRAQAAMPGAEILSERAGQCLFELNHYDAAASQCLRASILNPKRVSARYGLALSLDRLNKWQRAEAAYRAVLQLQPDHIKACNDFGVLLAKQQRYDEAAEQFRHVLTLQPDHVDAKVNLKRVEALRTKQPTESAG